MNLIELSKILLDESWLEGERRGKYVPMYDDVVFNRSVKIWDNLTRHYFDIDNQHEFWYFTEDWYYDVE
jgi:hypothetical protein